MSDSIVPNLEHLRKRAKRLVKATPGLQLATAQHQLAREHGYKNWAELIRKVEVKTISPEWPVLQRLVEAQRFVEEGMPAEALTGILWCLEEATKEAPRHIGVHRTAIVAALVTLARSYPPAQQALQEKAENIRLIANASADEVADLLPGGSPRDKGAYRRYQRAFQSAVRGEKLPEALSELLWCFDEGMKGSPMMRKVRRIFVSNAMGRLGKTYPPALEALRERRGKIRLNWQNDAEDWRDLVAINRALGEDPLTLEFYDELKRIGAPLPDPRWIFDQLVEAKRYADAVAAKPLQDHLKRFDDYLVNMAGPEQPNALHIGYLAAISAKQLEALAGAGDLTNARVVVAKMLQADNSPKTVETLSSHAARAGHPELISVS